MNAITRTLGGLMMGAILFTACTSTSTQPASVTLPNTQVLNMVSDAGGFDDKSFNESGYAGLTAAESDLGIEIATKEQLKNVEGGLDLLDVRCHPSDGMMMVVLKIRPRVEGQAKTALMMFRTICRKRFLERGAPIPRDHLATETD